MDSDRAIARLPLDSEQISDEINESSGFLGAFTRGPLEVMELSNRTAVLRLEIKTEGEGKKKGLVHDETCHKLS